MGLRGEPPAVLGELTAVLVALAEGDGGPFREGGVVGQVVVALLLERAGVLDLQLVLFGVLGHLQREALTCTGSSPACVG